MGLSNSVLEVAKAFRSFVSSDALDPSLADKLLSCGLSDVEMEQALPLDTIRELRHYYTKNFAFLLYQCIKEVAGVAERRAEYDVGKLVTADISLRFLTALRVLRRILPVALEDGTTPLECEREAARATDGADDNSDSNHSAPPQQLPGEEEPASTGDAINNDSTAVGNTTPSIEQLAGENSASRRRTQATVEFQRNFFMESRICDDNNPDARFEPFRHQEPEESPLKSLGTYLSWALVECCFIRDLTLHAGRVTAASPATDADTVLPSTSAAAAAATPNNGPNSLTHPEVFEDLLWYPGVGNQDPFAATSTTTSMASYRVAPAVHTCRKELLSTLLPLLSTPLYRGVNFHDTIFTEALISSAVVPLVPTLALSLLNGVLTYTPYGSLPYTSHFVTDEEGVVVASARVLGALLSYIGIPLNSDIIVRVPAASHPREGEEKANAHQAAAEEEFHGSPARAFPAGGEGMSAYSSSVTETEDASGQQRKKEEESEAAAVSEISQQHREQSSLLPPAPPPLDPLRLIHSVRKVMHDITLTEAKYILEKLKTIVGLRAYANQTFWPDSQHSFISQDEFMLVLWKLMDLSPSMFVQFTTNRTVLQYLVPLMDYAMDARRNPRLADHLQLVLFVLLRLSEARTFAVLCNQPFKEFVPFYFPKLTGNPTYHDFIITSLCLFMETKDYATIPLCTSCSVVLANLAPFVTSCCAVTSLKLVGIFTQSAQRCLRATRPSGDADAERNSSSSGGASVIQQTVMANTCEAIASLLQYQGFGARFVLAALVEHRSIVRRTREAYLVAHTHRLIITTALPFLVDTLDAAVTAAVPFVESASTASLSGTTNGSVGDAGDSSTEISAGIVTSSVAAAARPEDGVRACSTAAAALQGLTLVGVLPTPHRIIVRKFQSTKPIEYWALATFWTSMFMHSPVGSMGDNASVKLFRFA